METSCQDARVPPSSYSRGGLRRSPPATGTGLGLSLSLVLWVLAIDGGSLLCGGSGLGLPCPWVSWSCGSGVSRLIKWGRARAGQPGTIMPVCPHVSLCWIWQDASSFQIRLLPALCCVIRVGYTRAKFCRAGSFRVCSLYVLIKPSKHMCGTLCQECMFVTDTCNLRCFGGDSPDSPSKRSLFLWCFKAVLKGRHTSAIPLHSPQAAGITDLCQATSWWVQNCRPISVQFMWSMSKVMF